MFAATPFQILTEIDVAIIVDQALNSFVEEALRFLLRHWFVALSDSSDVDLEFGLLVANLVG